MTDPRLVEAFQNWADNPWDLLDAALVKQYGSLWAVDHPAILTLYGLQSDAEIRQALREALGDEP